MLPSHKRQIDLDHKLDHIVSLLDDSNKSLLHTVSRMTDAVEGQTKVFTVWMGMFTSTQDQPTRNWVPERDNNDFLAQKGMPENLSDAEQAMWVKNIIYGEDNS